MKELTSAHVVGETAHDVVTSLGRLDRSIAGKSGILVAAAEGIADSNVVGGCDGNNEHVHLLVHDNLGGVGAAATVVDTVEVSGGHGVLHVNAEGALKGLRGEGGVGGIALGGKEPFRNPAVGTGNFKRLTQHTSADFAAD